MNNFCLHPVGSCWLKMEESMAITLDLKGYGKLEKKNLVYSKSLGKKVIQV